MKKILYALVGLFFAFGLVGPADAGMNKRERANGNAEWVQSTNSNTYQIGRQIIHVRLTDLSTAASEYPPVIEAGIVTELHCAISAAITTSDGQISIADGTAAHHFGQITVTQVGSAIGDVVTVTGLSESVDAGATLVIGTSGNSATTSVVNCYVVIDPVAQ